MKCEICKASIENTFLEKPIGTYVKDKRGKRHTVCSSCQKRLGSKDVILKEL